MTPLEFKSAWEQGGGRLILFPAVDLMLAGLASEIVTFLAKVGLPHAADPCLEFSSSLNNGTWPPSGRYYSIGSDAFGNPLVIAQDGRVLWLDHDCGFAPHHLNKDIQTFAESLLRFSDMMMGIEEEAIFEERVPPAQTLAFRKFLADNDPEALAPTAFWKIETTFGPEGSTT